MPTPPRPVPWHEVIDIQGDLIEWLAERGHVRVEVPTRGEAPGRKMFGAVGF